MIVTLLNRTPGWFSEKKKNRINKEARQKKLRVRLSLPCNLNRRAGGGRLGFFLGRRFHKNPRQRRFDFLARVSKELDSNGAARGL